MVKKITEKRVGDITYELKHFEGDNRYVIYKNDNVAEIHRIPEMAVFDNEKEAREYLENLK